jgi:VWFA-related protein
MRPALRAQDASVPPTFRSTTDAVRVDVAVQHVGRPVTDLVATDFEILDNGVPQTISDFSFEQLPIDVSVALDVSKSVTGETLDRLQRGVTQLRVRLRPGDRLKLATFNMRVRRLFSFDDAAPDTQTAFASITATGSTSLVDTLMVLLTAPASPVRRHLIIAFSDAEDTSSVTNPDIALDIARRSPPTITIVRLLRSGGPMTVAGRGIAAGSQPSGAASLNSSLPVLASGPGSLIGAPIAQVFLQLTSETGGRVLQPSRDDTLPGTFAQVLDEFRSTYALSFAPKGVQTSGQHKLEVKVKRRGDFEIRARKGYVGD